MKAYLIKMPFFEQEYIKFSEKWEYIEDEYIGVEIVQSILESNGCDVVLNNATSVNEMVDMTKELKPDVVMISVMQTSARLTYRLVCELRKKGWNGKIFIGGWFAKMAWREIFQHNWDVDYVCYCDAEMVLEQWIRNPSAFYWGIATKENYYIHEKGRLNDLRKLNNWPERYVSAARKAGRKTYCIETSRGCPHSSCTFCSQSCGNVIPDRWRPLPLDLIERQITDINNIFGVNRFSTADDDLLGPIAYAEKRAKELRDLILRLPIRITFSASISVKAAANGRILDLLQEAGLEQLCVGFESADEEQLKRYGKQQSMEDNYLAAYEISKRKIPLLPGLITFDPFASKKTVEKNLNFLFENLHHYDLNKLTKKLHILTGTPMVKMARDAGLLKGDYLYYDYDFRDSDVLRLYESFCTYTNMVKTIQIEAKLRNKQYDGVLGIHHRKVAEAILKAEDWETVAKQEIEKMALELKEALK